MIPKIHYGSSAGLCPGFFTNKESRSSTGGLGHSDELLFGMSNAQVVSWVLLRSTRKMMFFRNCSLSKP